MPISPTASPPMPGFTQSGSAQAVELMAGAVEDPGIEQADQTAADAEDGVVAELNRDG